MIEGLQGVLGDDTVPQREQCREPACTNRRRGPGNAKQDLCGECMETKFRIAKLRDSVLHGPYEALWEVRCFGCEGVDMLAQMERHTPRAVCGYCQSEDVEVMELDPRVGGGRRGN